MKRYSKLVSKAIVNLVVFLALVGTLSIRVLAADNPTYLDIGKSIVKQYYIGDIKDSNTLILQDLLIILSLV